MRWLERRRRHGAWLLTGAVAWLAGGACEGVAAPPSGEPERLRVEVRRALPHDPASFTQGLVIAASWSGKLKTVSQVVAISLLILYEQLGSWQPLADAALLVALALSVYSGIEYAVLYTKSVLRGGEE